MKRVLFLLVVMGTLFQGNAWRQAESESPLRILSFNIRYNTPRDGKHAWPHRRDFVADLIGHRYRVDLAGLQEALVGQVNDLSERLEDYDWVGVGRQDGRQEGEFCSIFYRRDRLEILDSGTFWLSESPRVPGSQSWDSALPRIVTWAKFRDRSGERDFFHFNTHFDHRGEEARIQSAHLLVEQIEEIAEDFLLVVTGDFNATEGSEVYVTLQQGGLKDALYLSPEKDSPVLSTVNDWNRPRPGNRRIDFIWLKNGFKIEKHSILLDRHRGAFPSDHMPVLGELH